MDQPSTPTDIFDAHLADWLAYRETPWARVRYDVVTHVLDRHLNALTGQDEGPLRVLDLGGGDGADSLRLAGHGHHVTIVDPSVGMLARAQQAATDLGVTGQLSLVEASADDLSTLGLGEFDVALCHFVVQYVADAAATVGAVVGAVRPGGLVSLMAPNPPSDVLFGLVRSSDPAASLAVLDAAATTTATFDAEVARIEPAVAAGLLEAAGGTVLARYGVRCAVDMIRDVEVQHDPDQYDDIVALELALHDRSPYRDIARAWQLLARREL